MSERPQFITGAHVISPDFEGRDLTLEIQDGQITAVHSPGDALPEGDILLDAGGQRVLPGFIDIHTHGAGGHDVCDDQADSVEKMARQKLAEGVTTFLPTTLTLSESDLEEKVRQAAAYISKPTYAKAPGLHIEGPFINPDCVGAQNPDFVRLPSAEELFRLHDIAPVKLVSVAVEMEGGVPFVEEMTKAGIVTSAAHTAAKYADFEKAQEAGLSHLTHFCNQMTPLHHREIGLVGAGLLDDKIKLELICDQIHLCPEMLRMVFKLKAIDRLMLITDSIAASWLDEGTYTLGGLEVVVKDQAARLKSGALAGSTLRYHQGLKNVAAITEYPLKDLVRTTSLNQAQSLGLDNLGKIHPGFAADLVVMNADLDPITTIVDGEIRWQSTPS